MLKLDADRKAGGLGVDPSGPLAIRRILSLMTKIMAGYAPAVDLCLVPQPKVVYSDIR
jgi:hypothetical protein